MNMIDVKSTVLHLKLTKGSYSPLEAKELVLALLKTETAFHKLQNYKMQVRFDEPCTQAAANLAQAESAAEKLQRVVEEAAMDNRSIRVETVIRLTVED
jgi:hypothetical protein